jgi:predicted nuclease of restriction endonuclease-like (RecB) superfamily
MLNPSPNLIQEVKELLHQARQQTVKHVNQLMVLTYFEIGRKIVEEQQGGKERAEYGKGLLKDLSKALTEEFGKGFSVDNLQNMRTFYLSYSKYETVSSNSSKPISETLSPNFKLSWSHYIKLMRIDDENERHFYEIESVNNGWSLRELQRQYDSGLYLRLSLSRNKEEVKQLAKKGQNLEKPKDSIKDPYVLEFLGIPDESKYSESELEQKIIDKLEHFLLELGKGFTYVGRQVRFTFDEKHFRVDLVFYNRILQCFVLIDLKIGEITHQDLGQMQMYVNYYDRFVKLETENMTIGIVLCQDKNETLVEITLPENNEQIFASKYQTILPSKEELKRLIEMKE